MGLETLLTEALKQGGIAGLVVAATVLVVGTFMRTRGFALVGDKSRLVDSEQLDEVAQGVSAMASKFDGLEARVTAVERGLGECATRDEVHDLELAMTRLDGRLDTMFATSKATNASVTRIEDFLIRMSERSKSGD